MGDSLNYEIASFAVADPERKTKKYFGMKHGVMKFKGMGEGMKLKIHPDLAEIMGFENSEFCARLVDATLMPFSLPHSLYLYTNIIEPQIVGSQKGDTNFGDGLESGMVSRSHIFACEPARIIANGKSAYRLTTIISKAHIN